MKKTSILLLITMMIAFIITGCDLSISGSVAQNPKLITPVTDQNVFAIFTEQYTLTTAKIDLWPFDLHLDVHPTNNLVTTKIENVYGSEAAEGNKSKKATCQNDFYTAGTEDNWHGLGYEYRVGNNPGVTNMISWNAGSLHFFVKCPNSANNLSVGMKHTSDVWISLTNLPGGFTYDNSWHEFTVPLSTFISAGMDLTKTTFFFMMKATYVTKGEAFYFDDVYWSR